jgi:hypothetical protein
MFIRESSLIHGLRFGGKREQFPKELGFSLDQASPFSNG